MPTPKSSKVRLYIRIRRASGQYTYADPVYNRNHTVREGYALVAGKAEAHPEGVYYLRFLHNGKRVWEYIGTAADKAMAMLRNKEHDLQALALGRSATESATDPAHEEGPGVTVTQAIEAYMVNIHRFRSAKTQAACSNILGVFAAAYGTRPLTSITRADILDHTAALADKGLAPRTVFNHVVRIKSFLKSQGITNLLQHEDLPTYDEPEVEAYNTDELDSLFQVADAEERLLFKFFLATGLRDQEVQFCTWRNVDFKGKVISVKSKPDLGFRPKDKEERSVPVPDWLIEVLAERKRTSTVPFLFPTSAGEPDGHFLRRLQKLAHRAGLNCGECVNKKGKSCRTHAICGRWGLHKFRKTFATMHAEAGVPVTTIQRWLGHSDLATTLRYLAIADLRSDRTRHQVNTTFAGLAAGRLSDPGQPHFSGGIQEVVSLAPHA